MQSFRPTPSRYRGRFGPVLIGILVLGLLAYWRFDQPKLALLGEVLMAIGVSVSYILLFFRNSRITAAPRVLTVTSAFGTSHTVAERHLAKAVLVEQHVTSAATNATATPRLFLLDDEGHAVLHWSGRTWTEQQMRDLVEALDVPLTAVPGRVGSADIHRRYPHALGVWEGHPIAFAALIVVGLGALSVIVFTGF